MDNILSTLELSTEDEGEPKTAHISLLAIDRSSSGLRESFSLRDQQLETKHVYISLRLFPASKHTFFEDEPDY